MQSYISFFKYVSYGNSAVPVTGRFQVTAAGWWCRPAQPVWPLNSWEWTSSSNPQMVRDDCERQGRGVWCHWPWDNPVLVVVSLRRGIFRWSVDQPWLNTAAGMTDDTQTIRTVIGTVCVRPILHGYLLVWQVVTIWKLVFTLKLSHQFPRFSHPFSSVSPTEDCDYKWPFFSSQQSAGLFWPPLNGMQNKETVVTGLALIWPLPTELISIKIYVIVCQKMVCALTNRPESFA